MTVDFRDSNKKSEMLPNNFLHNGTYTEPWYDAILQNNLHGTDGLKTDLSKVKRVFLHYPYTMEHRLECFLEIMDNIQKQNLPTVLYFVFANPEIRAVLVELIVRIGMHENLIEFFKLLIVEKIFVNIISKQLHSHGFTESEKCIRSTCSRFLSHLFGRFSEEWLLESTTSVERTEQFNKRSLIWIKMIHEFLSKNSNQNGVFMKNILNHYSETLIQNMFIPKCRIASDEVYRVFLLGVLTTLIRDSEGVLLIREALKRYSQCEDQDNEFLLRLICFETSPCEVSSRDYLKRIFDQKFSQTEECRQIVLRTTQCLGVLIHTLNESAPPLKHRYNWQYFADVVFNDESNSEINQKVKNAYLWALHFSEIPSDTYHLLNHYLDFKVFLDEFLNSKHVRDSSVFETIFDLVSTSPECVDNYLQRFPKEGARLLESKIELFCESFLLPNLNSSFIANMKIIHPQLNVVQVERLHKRNLECMIRLLSSSASKRYVSEMYNNNNVFEVLQNVLAKFPDENRVMILFGLMRALLSNSRRAFLKVISKLDEKTLILFVSRLWINKELTKDLFNKIFPQIARLTERCVFNKFLKAIDALIDSAKIRESLEISDLEASEIEGVENSVVILDVGCPVQ